MARTSTKFNFLSAILAFLLWGSWAYYVNFSVSIKNGVISGLAQGTVSLVLTFFVISLTTTLYNFFDGKLKKNILTPIIVVFLLQTLLVSIHSLIGTPNILKTTIPPLFVALFFCAYTTFKLYKAGFKS